MIGHLPGILDIEASGFGPQSYPLEVGVVRPDGRKLCRLIRPEPTWTHWSDEAEALHGITRREALLHGFPVSEVACALNDFIGARVVYSDAWVLDNTWIRRLFFAAHERQLFSLSAIEYVMTEPLMKTWQKAREEVLSEATQRRHRASADAVIIQSTWRRSVELAQLSAKKLMRP